MQINKEMLEARKAQLDSQQQQLIAQLNMVIGAGQDVQWALSQLDLPEPAPAPVEAEAAPTGVEVSNV